MMRATSPEKNVPSVMAVVVVNLAVDLTYAFLNPRIRVA